MERRARQMSESIELGVLLALAGGFMDAYSYMARDQVFANAQTGNMLLFGVHLSEGDLALAFRYFLPVVAFAFGIMLADFLRSRVAVHLHWRQASIAVEAIILAGVSFIPIAPDADVAANVLISFACGMQVESFRKIHGMGIATTMCIGNLRSAMESIDGYLERHERGLLQNAALYGGTIGCFVVGAVIGNRFVDMFGQYALLACSVLLLVAFAVMFVDREHSAGGAPVGTDE